LLLFIKVIEFFKNKTLYDFNNNVQNNAIIKYFIMAIIFFINYILDGFYHKNLKLTAVSI